MCAQPHGQSCSDDGAQCTDDVCDGAGACIHPPRPVGVQCTDGLYCTGPDLCDGTGTCAGTGNPCGSAVCSDVCNEQAKACDSSAGFAVHRRPTTSVPKTCAMPRNPAYTTC